MITRVMLFFSLFVLLVTVFMPVQAEAHAEYFADTNYHCEVDITAKLD